MPHPTWLAYGFAVAMVSVSVYSIGRLALARYLGCRNHHDATVSHLLMGLAMAGMLAPGWNVLPDGWWEVVFAVSALYFLATGVRFVLRHGVGDGNDADHGHDPSHPLIHMVMAFAMLYMYWLGGPTTASGAAMAMSGPPAGVGDPSLTLLFIGTLLASAVWQLDSIGRFARSPALAASGVGRRGLGAGAGTGGDLRPWLTPRLEVACHIVMCLTMGYMLVLVV